MTEEITFGPHSTIAKIIKGEKVVGHIIQIEDQCYLLGACGKLVRDDRPMDEITGPLLKKGCDITFLAISVSGADPLTMYGPRNEQTMEVSA